MHPVLQTVSNIVLPYKNAPVLNGVNAVVNFGIPLKCLLTTFATLAATPAPHKDEFWGNVAKAACIVPLATACTLPFGLACITTAVCFGVNTVSLKWATNKRQEPVVAPEGRN